MEGEDRVVLVVFAGEQDLDALGLLLFPDLPLRAFDFAHKRFVVLLDGELGEGDGVFELVRERLEFLDLVLQALDLAQGLARGLLIVPERGVGGRGFEVPDLCAQIVDAERAAELFDVGAEVFESVFCFFKCKYHRLDILRVMRQISGNSSSSAGAAFLTRPGVRFRGS